MQSGNTLFTKNLANVVWFGVFGLLFVGDRFSFWGWLHYVDKLFQFGQLFLLLLDFNVDERNDVDKRCTLFSHTVVFLYELIHMLNIKSTIDTSSSALWMRSGPLLDIFITMLKISFVAV